MQGASARILLAEDNSAHAKLVIRSLTEHALPNTVTHVTNGEAALDYLLQHGDYEDLSANHTPDIIILDLKLPRIDGLKLLEIIKSTDRLRLIPVIMFSTSDADADILRAYELGVNSYVLKPTDFAWFSQMIDALGNYWLRWNRSPN